MKRRGWELQTWVVATLGLWGAGLLQLAPSMPSIAPTRERLCGQYAPWTIDTAHKHAATTAAGRVNLLTPEPAPRMVYPDPYPSCVDGGPALAEAQSIHAADWAHWLDVHRDAVRKWVIAPLPAGLIILLVSLLLWQFRSRRPPARGFASAAQRSPPPRRTQAAPLARAQVVGSVRRRV